mmetsp:Transcript_23102/g.37538  ORF Transcript_23102/g.37538 Transcript_23102/m.37538 type:complete len:198 (+) Transcript_23102:445-1038(+)
MVRVLPILCQLQQQQQQQQQSRLSKLEKKLGSSGSVSKYGSTKSLFSVSTGTTSNECDELSTTAVLSPFAYHQGKENPNKAASLFNGEEDSLLDEMKEDSQSIPLSFSSASNDSDAAVYSYRQSYRPEPALLMPIQEQNESSIKDDELDAAFQTPFDAAAFDAEYQATFNATFDVAFDTAVHESYQRKICVSSPVAL